MARGRGGEAGGGGGGIPSAATRAASPNQPIGLTKLDNQVEEKGNGGIRPPHSTHGNEPLASDNGDCFKVETVKTTTMPYLPSALVCAEAACHLAAAEALNDLGSDGASPLLRYTRCRAPPRAR